VDWISSISGWLDSVVAASLLPLAAWILISGIDDLFISAIWIAGLVRRGDRRPWEQRSPLPLPERRVAIFVPLWREDKVIAGMLGHNLAAIRYRHYDFFVGAYPNDEPTKAAVLGVAARSPNVHLCVCPHPGPTSKADCLNWIFQHMLLEEGKSGARFDIVVIHDAEDLIHPDALRWANQLIGDYDMVQTPVLPLRTPWREFTHGVYCDEFAEMHTKDLAVRWRLNGFIPSSGVGTAYSRRALDQLAESDTNRIFEPECLTEDYENGMRIHLAGLRQLFVPVLTDGDLPQDSDNRSSAGGRLLRYLRRFAPVRASAPPLATREFFPRRFRLALKQRTRWVTGIAFQAWERHGWGREPWQWYWLWRDRKGVIGNPLSLYANLLFFYGLISYGLAHWQGVPWGLGSAVSGPLADTALWITSILALSQLAVRTACTARVYGAAFALWTPTRLLVGNLLNSLATANAFLQFANARLRNLPLVWVKTDHSYPSPASLTAHNRPLGEILVLGGYLDEAKLAWALESKPIDMPLGEYLVRVGLLTEHCVTGALSLQSGMPAEIVDPLQVPSRVARALPQRLQRERRLIAVKVESGQLHLASPTVPDDTVQEEIRKHTRLSPRFVLVTPNNYRQLCERLL
jgi:adsorption protein B